MTDADETSTAHVAINDPRRALSDVQLAALVKHQKATALTLKGIYALLLASFVFVVAFFGREVLVPLAMAALLAFMVEPLVLRIQRFVGRGVAVAVTVGLVMTGIVTCGWEFSRQVTDLADRLPSYENNLKAKIQDLQVSSGGPVSKVIRVFTDLKNSTSTPVPDIGISRGSPGSTKGPGSDAASSSSQPQASTPVSGNETSFMAISAAIGPWITSFGTGTIVLLLMIFMLAQADDLQARFISLAGGRISVTAKALDDASSRVRKYLTMQVLLNGFYGAAVALSLFVIGLPNPLLWGGIAAIMRFVPYVGAWIAAVFPILLSLAVSPSWITPLVTIGVYAGLEALVGNVVEPLLYGTSTGVSSFALVVAAIFWTWIWGPMGLILSTPMTVCLVVLGKHIPQFAFLDTLLGEERTLKPAQSIYRLLLRNDDDDAAYDIIETYLEDHALAELYDDVLLPLLRHVEDDYSAALLDRSQKDAIMMSLRELVDEAEPDDAGAAKKLRPRHAHVLSIAGRNEKDSLAARMLAKALVFDGFRARAMTSRSETRQFLDTAQSNAYDIVFISSVPPSSPAFARGLCRRLRGAAPQQKIIVGLWSEKSVSAADAETWRQNGADAVVSSIGEAVALCANGEDDKKNDAAEAARREESGAERSMFNQTEPAPSAPSES